MHDENRQRRTLLVASCGSAVSTFDLSLIFVIYPSIRAAFPNVSLTKISFVLTVYTIVAAAFLIPAGRLADRIGRSRTFIGGVALFAVGSSAAALAPSVNVLIAARVVQAIGGAFISPSSLGLIMAVYPPERRSYALGIWSSITASLSSTAPVLGALVIRVGGWRWAFVLTLPLCLLCLVLGRRILERETVDRSQPLPDPLGAVMIAVALAALAYGIVQTSAWGWFDARILTILAVPIAIAPLLLWRCRVHPAPVIDLAVVRDSTGFKGIAMYAICVGALYWGALYVSVQLLTKGWGYSIVDTGIRMVPFTIPALVFGRVAGRMIDKHGFRLTMAPAALMFCTAMLVLAAIAGGGANMTYWIPAALFVGLCVNTLFIGANTAGAAFAPMHALSLMTGLVQTMIRMGGVIGSALAVSVVGDIDVGAGSERFRSPFLALAALAVVSAGTVLLLRERGHTAERRRDPSVEPAAPEPV